MRRRHRSQGRDRLGRRPGGRQFYLAQPAAQYSQSPTLQYESVPAQLGFLSKPDLFGYRADGRFSIVRARIEPDRIARGTPGATCLTLHGVCRIRTGVQVEGPVFEAAVSKFPG